MNEPAKFFSFPISALSIVKVSPADVESDVASQFFYVLRIYVVCRLADRLEGTFHGDSFEWSQKPIDATGVAEIFARHMEKYSIDEQEAAADSDEFETSVFAALEILGLTIHDLALTRSISETKTKLESVFAAIEHPHGKLRVSIRRDIFDDAVLGVISFRDFAVLCAIYANLRNHAVRMYYDQLAAMASGFCGQHVAQNSGQSADRFLTYKQIRKTVDDLWNRKLFAKVSSGRGFWISASMKQDDLVRYAASAEVSVAAKSNSTREDLKAAKAEILAKRAAADQGQQKGQLPKKQNGTRKIDANSRAAKRASSRASCRASSRAATEETSSEETSSEETSSEETSSEETSVTRLSPRVCVLSQGSNAVLVTTTQGLNGEVSTSGTTGLSAEDRDRLQRLSDARRRELGITSPNHQGT